MQVQLPIPEWPPDLQESGPPEDPSILLSGAVRIGPAPYRVLAIRINPGTLAVDYRLDMGDDIYDPYQLEELIDELTFIEEIHQSVLVPHERGHYALWMYPSRESQNT